MTANHERWQSATMAIDGSIANAIRNLDQSALRIVLILDSDGCLDGTVSDGDIRRGLLRGLGLDSPISEVIHRNPLVVPAGMSREMVQQLMFANKIQQIPIVDEQQRVIGLHLWDEIAAPGERTNIMVIMAGGKGTRLLPHTENIPKPLLPVAGKPILEHIIDRAHAEGFNRFVLAVHHLGHLIEQHFGNGGQLGVEIGYLREEQALGTAGALSLLEPAPDAPFVVTNGDVLTDVHYGELLDFHVRYDAAATMAVRGYEWQHPFGVVHTRGVDIVGFEEKPVARSHINAGVYALGPQALGALTRARHCDMPTLFERLREAGKRTVAYPMHEPWLDVGRPGDLEQARRDLQGTTTPGPT